MKRLLFFFRSVTNTVAVVWTVLFASGAAIQAAELKVGDEAPPFSLKGSDGKTYSLKDFAGKQAVVLAWFPKAFTGGCTKECKNLQADSNLIKKYDVAYFTVSVDSPEQDAKFAESLSVKDYAILADPTREVAKAYGVLKSENGVANRWTFYISKDGRIMAIDKKVMVDSHARDVATKLKELGVVEK
ncbi:MAG TPA: peroxiredoxin [Pirellulales bacterium]|jgi:peroxiredoxin Q/BCP|nr:peroxiredoxin [Pirellulales bacterium]